MIGREHEVVGDGVAWFPATGEPRGSTLHLHDATRASAEISTDEIERGWTGLFSLRNDRSREIWRGLHNRNVKTLNEEAKSPLFPGF